MRKTIAIVALCGLCGCGITTDDVQRKRQEVLQAESDRQVGLPRIANFTEKRLVATLYELRDQADLPTYTYTFGLDGTPRFLCRSIGFGLPYSAQFSNPTKRDGIGESSLTLDQAEPNGLFMPSSAEGTWILMATKEGPKPLYIEQRVAVTSVPLEGVPIPTSAARYPSEKK